MVCFILRGANNPDAQQLRETFENVPHPERVILAVDDVPYISAATQQVLLEFGRKFRAGLLLTPRTHGGFRRRCWRLCQGVHERLLLIRGPLPMERFVRFQSFHLICTRRVLYRRVGRLR